MKTLVKVANFVSPDEKHCIEKWFPRDCEDSIYRMIFMQLFYCNLQVKLIDIPSNQSEYDMLMNNKVDLAWYTTDYTYNSDNESDVEFTLPSHDDKAVLYVDSANFKQFTPNLLFYLCDWSLWLLIVSSFFLVLVYKYCYRWCYRKVFNGNFPNGFSEKLPFLFWALAFGIFCEIFQNILGNTLVVNLTVATVPFNNMNTLIRSLEINKCRIIITRHQQETWYDILPLNSSFTHKFFTLFNEHKIIAVDEEEEVIKLVRGGSCNIGVTWKSNFELLNTYYGNLQKIEIDGFPSKQHGWMYRKNSPYKHKFQLINTFGSPNDQYYNALVKEAEKLIRKTWKPETETNTKSLNINQLRSGFYVFLSGICLSCIVFLFDFVLIKLSSRTYTLNDYHQNP